MTLTVRALARTVFMLVAAGVLAPGIAQALTEEENKQLLEETKNYQFKTVKTKEGFNFKIPEDMPIETRAGITAPIPFEEYLYVRLKKLEEKLAVIEKKIDDLRDVFASTKRMESEKETSVQEKAGLLSSS